MFIINLSGKFPLNSSKLIFLISQPRSGSTLLQLLLAGHPDIATTSEPWICLHPIYALKKRGIDTEYNAEMALEALEEYLKQSGVDKKFYKQRLAEFLMSLYEESLRYHKKIFFLDKTPRYYHIASELMEIFPQAKLLILFRNPLSVLNSILSTWVKDDIISLGSYKDDLLVAPQKLLRCLELFSDRCLRVQYEELVTKPEIVLNGVCKFLNISYADDMLEYRRRLKNDWRFGDPVGVYKENRVTDKSLNAWVDGLNSTQKKHLALSYLKELGPDLVIRMGYDYESIKSSIGRLPESMSGDIITWSEAIDYVSSEKMRLLKILEEREADINTLLNAYSWKVTAPLRVIWNFVKNKKQKL